ncbi:reverse transcriptase domain-containing protein [Tanacetum coccineum]
MIDSQGIHVDPAKIEEVKNWAPPTTPIEVRQFLGLADYYRRFIEGFSKTAKSLTELTQKNKKYIWGENQESAFQLLKQKLYEAPILALPEGNDNFSQTEAIKEENIEAENLRGMDKAFEVRPDGTRCIKNQSWLPLFGNLRDLIIPPYQISTFQPHQRNREYGNIKETVSRHEVPISIISDRDSHFTSRFWQSMQSALAPFEALYGQKCQSPVCWAEVGDVQLIGPEIIYETTEKIV